MKTYAIRFKLEEVADGNLCCSVDVIEKKPGLDFYYKAIECTTIDIVPAYGLDGKTGNLSLCMVVDDEGVLCGKPINYPASILYGTREHGQPLVGDVLVCKDVETPEGINTEGFTAKEIETVWPIIRELLNVG